MLTTELNCYDVIARHSDIGTKTSYKYNDSGIRTQKTVNGVATNYFLDGSKIVAEKTGYGSMSSPVNERE